MGQATTERLPRALLGAFEERLPKPSLEISTAGVPPALMPRQLLHALIVMHPLITPPMWRPAAGEAVDGPGSEEERLNDVAVQDVGGRLALWLVDVTREAMPARAENVPGAPDGPTIEPP